MMPKLSSPCIGTQRTWTHHREASLNWLAFGLLLAAWNAFDDGAGRPAPVRRPPALRSHVSVSVRAATQLAVMQSST